MLLYSRYLPTAQKICRISVGNAIYSRTHCNCTCCGRLPCCDLHHDNMWQISVLALRKLKEGPCPSNMRVEHNSASQEIVMIAASNSASDIHPHCGEVSNNINASKTCFSAGMEVLGCQEDPVVAFASETLDRGVDNINAVEPSSY